MFRFFHLFLLRTREHHYIASETQSQELFFGKSASGCRTVFLSSFRLTVRRLYPKRNDKSTTKICDRMTHPYSIVFVECLHTTLLVLRHTQDGLAIVSRTFVLKGNIEEAIQTFPFYSPVLVGVPGNAPDRER